MNLGPLEGRVVTLFDSGGTLTLAIFVAAAAGALHALAPGHGKTLTAAYLVGQRGRPRHAVVLGLAVAAMHTVSVATLAVGWYVLVDVVSLELGQVTAVLQLFAALVAVALGLGMLARQRRQVGHVGHEGHSPPAGGMADLGNAPRHHVHRHRTDADAVPWSRRGLVALGLAGGLVPSPSAFLVLISGLLAGRLAVAIGLVASFAIGMAATLAAVGVAALRGRDLLDALVVRRPRLQRSARALPTIAALGVTAGGTLLAVRAAGALVSG